MIKIVIWLIVVCLAAAPTAQAQNYQSRTNDLTAIATIFGELHHIRRSCEP